MLYEDPDGVEPPNLLWELGRYVASDRVSHREDHLTVLLAWVCNADQDLARAVLRFFLRGDRAALTVARQARLIRARTHLTLPNGRGSLYPDLSMETEADSAGRGRMQLLVEVKWGAAPHRIKVGRRQFLQPDAYAAAWDRMPAEREARVRRVGTLSTAPAQFGGAPVPTLVSVKRARDRSWAELVPELESAADGSPVSPVLSDLVAAACLQEPDQAQVDAAEGAVRALGEQLRQRDEGWKRPSAGAAYWSLNYYDANDEWCWLAVTVPGSPEHQQGRPPELVLSPGMGGDSTLWSEAPTWRRAGFAVQHVSNRNREWRAACDARALLDPTTRATAVLEAARWVTERLKAAGYHQR